MSKFAIFALVASLVVLPGCAHITKALGPLLPEVEANFADNGFRLSIDPEAFLNILCVEPDGRVSDVLGALPFAGEFLADLVINDLIGACPVAEEPALEVVPEVTVETQVE
jgi:hypothetical protein